MEQQKETRREARFPEEIVEVYRQPEYREVVETYSAPLPASLRKQPVRTAETQKNKRGKLGLWVFLGCFLAAVVLAVLSFVLGGGKSNTPPTYRFEWRVKEAAEEQSEEITIPAWPTGQGAKLEVVRDHGEALTIQEVYKKVNPAVVSVMTQMGTNAALGTGVIFTEDGYILTNHHVVAGGEDCAVWLSDGNGYSAKYVAGDAENDLAVLKIDGTGLPTAEFGDSDALEVGDPAYAIGNPLGVELRGTLTDGIISAINRDVEIDGSVMTLLQTNAALNTGNSGGPLINQYGQVVGINVIKLRSSYTEAEGLGFAIPSALVERMANDLLTYGELKPEPLLGISVWNEGTQLEEELWGAEVDSVVPGGAGDRAGIRKGDFIIEAGGTKVEDSSDVLWVRRQYHVGEEMPVTIWRNGEIIEVLLQLEDAVE